MQDILTLYEEFCKHFTVELDYRLGMVKPDFSPEILAIILLDNKNLNPQNFEKSSSFTLFATPKQGSSKSRHIFTKEAGRYWPELGDKTELSNFFLKLINSKT